MSEEVVKTQTLALEFRPKTWEELIGQDIPSIVLVNSLRENDIKPGYLFTGSSGCGKTSAALLFAKRLLCHNPDVVTQNSCNECRSCQLADKGINADIKYVDGAADRSVSFVRDVIKPYLNSAPLGGKKRVIILDEAHLYGKDAISAFLTLLEQLPRTSPKSLVIFCTTEGDAIDPAIRNRCMGLNFAPISADSIAKVMAKFTKSDPEMLKLLAEESGGSFRTIWAYIEVWQHTKQELTEELIMKLVNGITRRERTELWDAIRTSNTDKIVSIWGGWVKEGASPKVVTNQLKKDLILWAANNPDKGDWKKALALLSGAALISPESTCLPALLQLCGLPLETQYGDKPRPEERQPAAFSKSSERVVEDLYAKRMMFFGA